MRGIDVDKNTPLTKEGNFLYGEFYSNRVTPPPEEYIHDIIKCAEELQKVRNIIKQPIFINSAYRTPQHNADVGGEKSSYHMKGMAVDTKPKYMYVPRYFAYLVRYTDFNGFGLYKFEGFVHADLRDVFRIFKV